MKDYKGYSIILTLLKASIIALIVLTVPILLMPLLVRSTGNQKKPNFILFISDDHGYEDSGCYGNPVVNTPNIDHLAEQGMRFTNAFTGSPTCTPSRALLYSGLMPFQNGCHQNHGKVNPGTKTLPEYLKPLGYRVVLIGKTDTNPKEEFPFEYVVGKLTGDRAPDIPLPFGWDLDTMAVDSIINDHVSRYPNKPLCLVICTHRPHVIWRWKNYDPEVVIVPPYLVNTPISREAIARYYSDVTVMDRRLGGCLRAIEEHGLRDNSIFIYTSDQGAQFPHAKWNLYDMGIRVPLIVRWSGKIESGSVNRAMISTVDILPTLIEAAGGKPPSELDGRSILSLILGKKSEHRKYIFASHSRDGDMNIFPTRCIRSPRYKYILNLKPSNKFTTHITNGQRGSRTYWNSMVGKATIDYHAASLIYMDQHRPAQELYDIKKDPYELNNIAYEEKYSKLIDSLRKKLLNWMDDQNDPYIDSVNIEDIERKPGLLKGKTWWEQWEEEHSKE
jgi:N-sulfoglucosamine sulfohydrolase